MRIDLIRATLSKPNLSIVLFIFLIIILNGTRAFPSEIKLIPKLSLRESYDDNIDFTKRQKIDDYITTVIPSLGLNRDSENSHIKAGGSAYIRRYSEKQRFNKTDQYYNLAFDYNPSPLFNINAKGSFTRYTIVDREQVDTELEEMDLIYTRSERKATRLQPGITWRLSELDSISLTSGYITVEYDDPTYSDYDTYHGILSWGRVVAGGVGEFFINGGYGATEYEKTSDKTDKTKNLSLFSGFDLSLSPQWSLNFWAGARRTILDYYQQGEERTERNWGGIGSITLKRLFERGYVSGELKRDIIPTGKYKTVERNLARVKVNYRFTKRLNGVLSSSLRSSKSESEYDTIDEDFYSLTSSITYTVLPNTNAKVSFTRTQLKDHKDFSTTRRNVVFIQITTYWEKFL